MAYSKQSTAYNSISARKRKLDSAIADIYKQFSQMDLSNNTAQEEIKNILARMENKSIEIKRVLNNYNFY